MGIKGPEGTDEELDDNAEKVAGKTVVKTGVWEVEQIQETDCCIPEN